MTIGKRAIDSRIVQERARELGIKGPKEWKKNYGIGLDQITPEDALRTMNDHEPMPAVLFPDRWRGAIAASTRSAEEIKKFKRETGEMILEGHRAYFRRKAAEDGHPYPEETDSEGHSDRDVRDGPGDDDRPVFGQPAPRKGSRIGPRSGDRVLSGMDGR